MLYTLCLLISLTLVQKQFLLLNHAYVASDAFHHSADLLKRRQETISRLPRRHLFYLQLSIVHWINILARLVIEIVLYNVWIRETLETHDFIEYSPVFVAEDTFRGLICQQHSLSFFDCLVTHIEVILSNNLSDVFPLLLISQSYVL